ncbi:MAG: hypothetical protein KBE65_19930 [Phycisphaerae bacterium]|nr:hypothetical protein [Phycisphaerae bacterium]
MRHHAREDLTELLRQFMEESRAQDAKDDIESGERLLEAHSAPLPSPETLSVIKSRMVATAHRKSVRVRIFRTAAVAAAVIVAVLIGRFDRSPADRPGVSFASMIPAAVWESHDIAADDPDLAYFTSQIRQIETQLHDIETGGSETRDNGKILDDIEVQLIAIDTEFWKG